MDLRENEKSRISFALSLLSEKTNSGYKLQSFDIKTDSIVFFNDEKNQEERISIKKLMKDKDKDNDVSDTSATSPTNISAISPTNISDTSYDQSGVSTTSDIQPMKDGFFSKNIFQKAKYSETSSLQQSNMSEYSVTSSDIYNGRSDKYSDTSVIKQVGGRSILTSDTLVDISELKQRKSFKSIPTPNLDMGIFTKKSQTQSGGSVDNIKRKMMDIGINSNSSTSSICE